MNRWWTPGLKGVKQITSVFIDKRHLGYVEVTFMAVIVLYKTQ